MNTDVVVIDSGANTFIKERLIGGVNLSDDGDINDIHDNIGHGSSITNLLLNHAPKASIYMIKVCNDYNGFSFDVLCKALEYILSSDIRCKLINISMGIVRLDNYSKLHDLIVALRNKNIVIISAYQNTGIISYPAGFDEVIGIDCSPSCKKRDEFEYVENSIINVRASSAYFHAYDSNGRKILANGTSYATANLTGILLKNTRNYLGSDYYNHCLSFLREKATFVYGSSLHIDQAQKSDHFSCCDSNDVDIVKLPKWDLQKFLNNKPKAVVFPFNKEIHSMARFESMLDVDLVGYYDHRISLNNKKNIRQIIGQECSDKIIKPIIDLDWTSDFELFVCGHCNEMQSLTHDNVFKDIIINCLKYGKKLYCFDDPRSYLKGVSLKDLHNIYFPHIDKSMIKPNRFEKLRKSSKPVVGIYGTSSKQGKHTLQLHLRKLLLDKGFRVGELGTEPHGYLFGFDFVYPMGYNSSIQVDKYDAVKVLNEAMWEIERKDPDIIITGGQSNTVPYNVNILSNLNFSSYEFLVGTAPDVAVLCINYFDSIDYIEKSVKFLESVGNAKVIALVVFPIDGRPTAFNNQNEIIDAEDINQVINILTSKIKIKTYLNSKASAEILCDDIIKFFS